MVDGYCLLHNLDSRHESTSTALSIIAVFLDLKLALSSFFFLPFDHVHICPYLVTFARAVGLSRICFIDLM